MSNNKFSTGLVKEYREQQEEAKRQEQLKDKYDIQDDVVIVEKANTFKFVVSVFIRLFKLLALVILIVLAFVGLMGIIYPSSRAELLKITAEIYGQIKTFFGF